jgi:hypothetical protein
MSSGIRQLLRQRYCPKEWALLEEVRNRTGYGKEERYADAVAMNLYPSRGLEVLGFEIKVSKSDWKRELALPDKSAPIQKYCDRWFIVAPEGIVDKNSLPKAWGLMEPNKAGTQLVTRVEAPPLQAVPLDRAFVASVLRNANEAFEHRLKTETLQSEAYARGKKEGEERYVREHKLGMGDLEQRLNAALSEAGTHKRAIQEFERKSGIHINSFDGPKLGEAVYALMRFGGRGYNSNYAYWLKTALQRVREPLEEVLKVIQHLEVAGKLIGEQHDRQEDGDVDAGGHGDPGLPD